VLPSAGMTPAPRNPTQTEPSFVQGSRAEPVLELERVRARDPEALGAFFERYFDRVYGLAFRLLGDRAAAEDAAQEVFLKVHRAADRLDPARDPDPWLLTITTNVCRDLWRSGAHRLSRRSSSIDDNPAVGGALASPGKSPEAELLAGERQRLVQDAITRLPENLREAVVLREYQGLGYDEIASMLGINEAAARKRYSRALAELGRLLKGQI
jgi:RNA polymerase sigma-70 factor (ECF subfamily)